MRVLDGLSSRVPESGQLSYHQAATSYQLDGPACEAQVPQKVARTRSLTSGGSANCKSPG